MKVGAYTTGRALRFEGNAAMTEPQTDPFVHQNQLLGAFEEEARSRLEGYLQPVSMKLGEVVCEAGGLLKHAYFPQGSVLSLITVLENGSAVECANIGREGAFGIFAAMYSRTSFTRCIIQLEGPMLRCPIEPLQREFEASNYMKNLLVSFSETLLSQVMQTVACNALHTVQRRICRWLLMMHDRAEGAALTYTHEFLAHILGVNRTSITLAAPSMQREGLISYSRGAMQVLDRARMERASCECYSVVKDRFDNFLRPPATAVQETTSRRTQTP